MKIIHQDPKLQAQRVAAIKVLNVKICISFEVIFSWYQGLFG